ncbi:MAG: squalene--hopene cyclase [Planctomycetota bacterium]
MKRITKRFSILSARLPMWGACLAMALLLGASPTTSWGQRRGEITPQSEKAIQLGLDWLAKNQGPEGNWGSNHLGLVSLGVLAFLSDGHTPGHGKYGPAMQKSLNFVLTKAKPSGLLNISDQDMYNHGLSTFVLGQAYGMTDDKRIGPTLDRALKVIIQCQGPGGGWSYSATPTDGDLSLSVMQAKALRSAMDSGFDIPPSVIEKAIKRVRGLYKPDGCAANAPEEEQKKFPGWFTYNGGGKTVAMAAAGAVCMQEYAQYDDWRIAKSLDQVETALIEATKPKPDSAAPFDAYTLYYVAQALYQAGGERWKRCYPLLRDRLVYTQVKNGKDKNYGSWGGEFWPTSVSCFVLAIPNRYLPILQEGRKDNLRKQNDKK